MNDKPSKLIGELYNLVAANPGLPLSFQDPSANEYVIDSRSGPYVYLGRIVVPIVEAEEADEQ